MLSSRNRSFDEDVEIPRLMVQSPYQIFPAVSISSFVLREIYSKDFRGVVHSVFDRTVNCVSFSDTLITIAKRELGNLPNGILLDVTSNTDMHSLGIRKGMGVARKKEWLLIPDASLAISLHNASLWSARRKICPLINLSEIKSNLGVVEKMTLAKAATLGLKGFVRFKENIVQCKSISKTTLNNFYESMAKPLGTLIEGIKTQNLETIKESACRLVGFGQGLTPSGDDILTGLIGSLLVTRCCADDFFYVMSHEISDIAESSTNMVSRMFIKHAAVGELAEVLFDMIKAILTANEDAVVSSTLKVLSLGRTSGIETAFGVLLGLELRLKYLERNI